MVITTESRQTVRMSDEHREKLTENLKVQLDSELLTFQQQGIPVGTRLEEVYTIEGNHLLVRLRHRGGPFVERVEARMKYNPHGNPAGEWLD